MTQTGHSKVRGGVGLLAAAMLLVSEIATGECALAATDPRAVASETSPPTAPAYHSSLPVEGVMPSFDGATGWLNSPPIDVKNLRGKVVLVDFWAYSCINCIRMEPYIRSWAAKYRDRGLVVIGVHTPEFKFETDIENIRRATKRFSMTHPIAIDSNRVIWQAFGNQYWPALYFIDAEGRVRHHQFGEGDYETSERVIRELLAETDGRTVTDDQPVTTPRGEGAEAAPDIADIRSEETYLGYERATGFASPEGIRRNAAERYTAGNPASNQWSLEGDWTIGPERVILNTPEGGITYRFRARDLHLVLGHADGSKPVRFTISIDGAPPGGSHGSDTDQSGKGIVTDTRLYQLVRQSGGIREHTFKIHFFDAGVTAYSFTFG
ncbi:thioredoxin family protein [Acetobacter estunensis]|uniref:thioredoxin family protein n=1 Tax=Acetobacter estunensis TaxID=104097 RepID=UPI001C2D999B|nr:thioredoxin family protein [Acetobacter estunensis]MBV1838602.1 thioredoxin family protein [Acetobacter estunensis]